MNNNRIDILKNKFFFFLIDSSFLDVNTNYGLHFFNLLYLKNRFVLNFNLFKSVKNVAFFDKIFLFSNKQNIIQNIDYILFFYYNKKLYNNSYINLLFNVNLFNIKIKKIYIYIYLNFFLFKYFKFFILLKYLKFRYFSF